MSSVVGAYLPRPKHENVECNPSSVQTNKDSSSVIHCFVGRGPNSKDLSGIATEPSAPPQHLASKIFRRLAAGRADRAHSGVCGGRGCGEGEMDLFWGEGMTRG